MSTPLHQLETLLDYRFTNADLANLALTHRSASKDNNERLEYLGDALLDFIVGEILFHRYPQSAEGDLSQLRAKMVNKSALAHIGKELRLGDFLRLGMGESKSGGKQRESILADAVEALIAAVYLDGGLEPCRDLVDRLTSGLQERFQAHHGAKDAKTRLQEWLQAQGRELPSYQVTATEGEAHQQVFHVECHISGLEQATEGSGNSKRKAEQAAAELALAQLEVMS